MYYMADLYWKEVYTKKKNHKSGMKQWNKEFIHFPGNVWIGPERESVMEQLSAHHTTNKQVARQMIIIREDIGK